MASLNGPALDTLFILVTVALLAAACLLIMDCIWRTEGKFDKYLKLIASAFALLLLKNILLLFGLRSYEYSSLVVRTIDLLQVLFFLFSTIELFIIIRSLSGESELQETEEQV